MSVFHTDPSDTSWRDDLVEGLRAGLQALRLSSAGGGDFERVEGEVHGLFVTAERAFIGEALSGLDVNLPQLWIDGKLHHRVLRSAESRSSMTTATRCLCRMKTGCPGSKPLTIMSKTKRSRPAS